MTQKKFNKKPEFKDNMGDVQIFNRSVIKMRRERIANRFKEYDFLKKEISSRLIDNVQDIKRDFNNIVNLGCHEEILSNYFHKKLIINQDLSFKIIENSAFQSLQADEEFLPYQNQCLDLIISCLSLHWVNDLPGTFSQILHSLKPDGLFIGALFGGETLTELRQSMLKADIDIKGGISPHISPFIDIRDAGALMQRAGFTLPVVNIERITVMYSDAFSLMKDLKAMGENNALFKRYKGLSSKKLMMATAQNYQDNFANDENRIPATFDIIYLQGWAPHESQQKPLKPGSAKTPLKDVLGKFPPENSKTENPKNKL